MSDKFFKLKNKKRKQNNRAFTLIELLVVVAIIGILSSVVLASLNSAREKSNVALIKSTLKQLYAQAQINFTENGSFVNSNPSNTDLTCTGPGNNLAKIVQPLIDKGIIVKCFSYYNSSFGDLNRRFGATALMYDTSELKAWSVDENGVVKLDTSDLTASNLPGGVLKTWTEANMACLNNGGRLPSLEQIKSLVYSWRQGSGDTTWTPVGISSNVHWTSSANPSSPGTLAYYQHMDNTYGGANSSISQTNTFIALCVR